MSTDDQFFEALHYLHVAELRALCEQLHLVSTGKKVELLNRIFTFVTTGKIVKKVAMPSASKAKKGEVYVFSPSTRMMFGAYKNDAATRAFLKQLIGAHFHFTASGIDWLNERWYAANPPTYQEFAEFWQHEYELRKHQIPAPKHEWAYIRFLQRYAERYPDMPKDQVLDAWEKERSENVECVYEYVRKIA